MRTSFPLNPWLLRIASAILLLLGHVTLQTATAATPVETMTSSNEVTVTNVSEHNKGDYNTPVITRDGHLYWVYVAGVNRSLVVFHRRPDGSTEQTTLLASQTADLFHRAPSLGIDRANRLHVAAGTHHTSWQYWRADQAHSIASFTFHGYALPADPMTPPYAGVSYPAFFHAPNGQLYLTNRGWVGTTFVEGNSAGLVSRFSEETNTWTALGGIEYNPPSNVVYAGAKKKILFYEAQGPATNAFYQAYKIRLAWDANNTLYATTAIYTRICQNENGASHILAAKSSDGGDTWMTLDGQPISALPLGIGRSTTVVYRPQADLVRIAFLGTVGVGRPIIGWRGNTAGFGERLWVWEGDAFRDATAVYTDSSPSGTLYNLNFATDPVGILTFAVRKKGATPGTFNHFFRRSHDGALTMKEYQVDANVDSAILQFDPLFLRGDGGASSNTSHIRYQTFDTNGGNGAVRTVNFKPYGAPTITTEPIDRSVAVGSSAEFALSGTGDPVPTYQWFSALPGNDFVPLVGATGSVLITSPLSLADQGRRYKAILTNSAGSVESTVVQVTITDSETIPTITSQPTDVNAVEGISTTLVVAAIGSPTPAYQWQSKFGSGAFGSIPGATSANYSFIPEATESGKIYRVLVSNTKGTTISNNVSLTVYTKPVIISQPNDAAAILGGSVIFSVSAQGFPAPTYQWQVKSDGDAFVDIPGANTPTYAFTAASADTGKQFQVVISNVAGETTSNPATLTLNTSPSIVTPPTNKSVATGVFATFSVVAVGNPAPSYQWQWAPAGSDAFVNIPSGIGSSSVTSSYTTAATVAGDNGRRYRVVVTNSVNSVTSAFATLLVGTAPSISGSVASKTVTAPETATFSVTATGDPAPTYQWQSAASTGSFANISGGTANSYSTGATVGTDDGRRYRVVVSNGINTATSNAATLTVWTRPAIGSQPGSLTVTAGANAVFTVTAAGQPALSYQWQSAAAGSEAFAAVNGGTGSSVTVATVAGDDGKRYRALISNSAGTVTSAVVILTVQTAPAITSQPSNKTVNATETATFTLAANGKPTPTMQWQRRPVGGSFANVSGATGLSLTTAATVAADDGAKYRAVITNGVGTVTSNEVTLSVRYAPTITTAPGSLTVTVGTAATFSVVATGNPVPSYQWQVKPAGGSFSNAGGATTTSYNLSTTAASDSGLNVRVVVSNGLGTMTSNPAVLTVQAATGDTLFGTTVPTPSGDDDENYELGVKFKATSAGHITAIRVFRAAASLGSSPTSYTGRLWTAGGTQLARVTINAPTTGAWAEASLSSPVSISANTTYVVSYNVPKGKWYQATNDNLATVKTSGALKTIADGKNGVYAVGMGTFPTQSWKNSNYYADVRFVPTASVARSVALNADADGWNNVAGGTGATMQTGTQSLADSGSQYRVVVSNGMGSVTSDALTLNVELIDKTAPVTPAAPTVNGLTISGTSEPHAVISVTVDGIAGGSVTSAANGTWSWTAPSTIASGSHPITVTATDAAGNRSAASPTVIMTVAPAGTGSGITPPPAPSPGLGSSSSNNGGSGGGCGAGGALALMAALLLRRRASEGRSQH